MVKRGLRDQTLEFRLWKRLRMLESIRAADDKARFVLWHRMDEVRRALELNEPFPMPEDLEGVKVTK